MKYGTAALIGIPTAALGYGMFVKKLPALYELKPGSYASGSFTPYDIYKANPGLFTISDLLRWTTDNLLGRGKPTF